MQKVYIIAEAGVNHNGSLDIAKALIDEAYRAGADAVKFQTFKAENLASKTALKASYQKQTTNANQSQYDMLKALELSYDDHVELISHAKSLGIDFLSTPFDIDSANMLYELGIKSFKIPSGEITNLPLLRTIAKFQKPIILSTGMATMSEIGDALSILTQYTKLENITILHANTQYPTPFCDVNLKAMNSIGAEFGVKFGYSDHTLGIYVPIGAVALGASVIEKHFTLDKTQNGPDHKASLEPNELKMMVDGIRAMEASLGDGIKRPSPSEIENINIVRKSIVAKRDIIKGEILNEQNITTKRSLLIGISPMKWDKVIGQIAKKDYKKDEII
ncbi:MULTISPECIES: N-acetylneuraminate synthase [Campylobacter]|uniref:N-acetylneuraminate synthase n=1 Tax=Campylobacter TaxID=194 RepID=UPI000A351EA5|nr:N-acetylneuraminate synthase [Campylobacter sp. P0024]MCR8679385.1 N-acetylneuraminate synthase [Campylobacter sp. RM19072]MEE3705183.1 N-acetylneuraminate synthase [Campylobacter sp. CX2-8023-23]